MKSSRSKILHPVAGKPLIHHVLDTTAQLDPQHRIIVVGNKADAVRASVASSYSDVVFVAQQQQLGTADAVKATLPALQDFEGIVLVLYADSPFVTCQTLQQMQQAIANQSKPGLVVLGFEPEDPARYGRLVLHPNGALNAIVEYNDASQQERAIGLCNSGVMGFDASSLQRLLPLISNDNTKAEYYLTDMVELAVKNTLDCAVIIADEAEVMGINSQAERAAAEATKQQQLRQHAMDAGVMMIAPDTVYLQDDTQWGRDVIIHPFVVIGPDVSIGDGVEIKSFSHLEQATIHANAVVGPYARLRPGASIGEDARVGNFVEIKNATLKAGAKVSHLSYIGDATVGSDANIGAGTITCNYNGFEKFQTHIGDGAFIGSNSCLVAPIEIGDGAIIGAGSTVTKNVEKDALAISDRTQKQLAGKAKAYRERYNNK